jgi:hypothetical protein
MRFFGCCPIQIAPAGTPIVYPLEYTFSGGHAKTPMLLISPLFGASQLVIDLTGVGLAVGDLFQVKGQEFTGILITGGTSWRQERWNEWHVSKHLLVSTVQKVLSSGALAVGRELPQAGLLQQELRDFSVKISKAATEVYEAREGAHDDLVLSLAIALFVAEQYTPVMSW